MYRAIMIGQSALYSVFRRHGINFYAVDLISIITFTALGVQIAHTVTRYGMILYGTVLYSALCGQSAVLLRYMDDNSVSQTCRSDAIYASIFCRGSSWASLSVSCGNGDPKSSIMNQPNSDTSLFTMQHAVVLPRVLHHHSIHAANSGKWA